MTRWRCDLHIHSCLSPCADDDMTPANIAGMAMLCGLQLVALTDHNSCKNCPAFFAACGQYGLVPVPGMELNTAEEIHLICLFPSLEAAMAFDKAVEARLLPVQNRPEIFGRQILMGEDDAPRGEVETLLITATGLTLAEAAALCLAHGGACYPAHIDRESNGILAVLGSLPERPAFSTLELSALADPSDYARQPAFSGKRLLISSDAHQLQSLCEGEYELDLDLAQDDAAGVRSALIALLREGIAL